MAHEFNNILTGIMGSAALLEESLPTDDERRQDARTIVKLGEKAAMLVGLLLNFSRKQSVFPAQVDLRRFLIEKAALLRKILGEGVEDRIEMSPDLPSVSVDRDQLWQMISSLAVNAREAMDGTGVFSIRAESVARLDLPGALCPAESAEYVHLTFCDDGRGMAPELAALLFEPFLTTKPVGAGTGLSLASVHGIVNRAGGDLSVETSLGEGTVFHIYFPASASEQKQRPGARSF
jgi:two-component system cell cycle sensor histidine kinase/response regulator CckA